MQTWIWKKHGSNAPSAERGHAARSGFLIISGQLYRKTYESEDYHLVYADNAATAKMSKKALKAYCDCAKNHCGNPSTAYEVGMDARGYLDQARSVMRTAFNLKGGSNIFTSGGSACNTGSVTPSHVLLALGLSEELAESAVRISLTRTIPRRTPTTS